jgi:hypothetical protein
LLLPPPSNAEHRGREPTPQAGHLPLAV